jgi:hypothetical protein
VPHGSAVTLLNSTATTLCGRYDEDEDMVTNIGLSHSSSQNVIQSLGGFHADRQPSVRRITSFALGCYQRVTILADSNSFSTGTQSIDVSGWKAMNGVLTKRHERIVRLVMHTLTSTINHLRAEEPVEMLDGESTALFRRKKLCTQVFVYPVSKDLPAARFWLIM